MSVTRGDITQAYGDKSGSPDQLLGSSQTRRRTYAHAASSFRVERSQERQVNSIPVEGLKTVVYRKSVRGTRSCTNPGTQDSGELVSTLRLKSPPHRDFCLRGFPEISKKTLSEVVPSWNWNCSLKKFIDERKMVVVVPLLLEWYFPSS